MTKIMGFFYLTFSIMWPTWTKWQLCRSKSWTGEC